MAQKNTRNARAIAESIETEPETGAETLTEPESVTEPETEPEHSPLSDALTDAGEALADIAESRSRGALTVLIALDILSAEYAEGGESMSADAIARAVQAEALSIRLYRMTGDRPATDAETKAASDGLSLASVKAYASAGALLASRDIPFTERAATLAYYAATGGLLKPLRKLLTADAFPEGMQPEERESAFETAYTDALTAKAAESTAKAESDGAGAGAEEPEESGDAPAILTEPETLAEGDALETLRALLTLLPGMSPEGRETARAMLSESLSALDALTVEETASASA